MSFLCSTTTPLIPLLCPGRGTTPPYTISHCCQVDQGVRPPGEEGARTQATKNRPARVTTPLGSDFRPPQQGATHEQVNRFALLARSVQRPDSHLLLLLFSRSDLFILGPLPPLLPNSPAHCFRLLLLFSTLPLSPFSTRTYLILTFIFKSRHRQIARPDGGKYWPSKKNGTIFLSFKAG